METPSDPGRRSAQQGKRGCAVPVPQRAFPTPFPGTEVW